MILIVFYCTYATVFNQLWVKFDDGSVEIAIYNKLRLDTNGGPIWIWAVELISRSDGKQQHKLLTQLI